MSEKEFIVLVAFLMSIVAISIDALLPAFGAIGTTFGITNSNHIQFVIGSLFLGMSLGQLIIGPVSDALGRKRALYFSVVIYMLGTFFCLFAPSLKIVLIGRFIEGLGVSGPYVSAVSIVRDRFAGRQMAKIMSLVMMMFILVPAIAPSLGQAILLVASWREIFVLYLFYAAIVTGWIYFRLEETLPPSRRIPFKITAVRNGFVEVTTNIPTVCYTVSMGICFGSFVGYLNSSQQIFQEQFGAGKLFSIYFGLLALVLGVASLLNSRFVERFGMHRLCLFAFTSISVSSIIFLIVNLTLPIHLWMFLLYAAVLFFSFGLVFGNLNSMAMEPMGHIAGIASAIIGSTSSLLSLTIGSIIGQLYNRTLIPMNVGFLTFGTIALFLIIYARKVKTAKPA